MTLADQIEEEAGPKRDRWGRPLLLPISGDAYQLRDKSGRTAYARASSLSDYASGVKTGLEIWKRRQMAVGLAQREDIAAMLAALPPMDTGDDKSDRVTKAQVDEYLEMAHEAAGGNVKANYGTAIHSLTVEDAGHTPERMQADVDAYYRELEALGIRPLLDEVFIANDDLVAAGTFDHLYLMPDGAVVVGDKKTGKQIDLLDISIQLAVYAGGDAYDWTDDSRVPLEVLAETWGLFDDSVGLLVEIPAGTGTCRITELNLYEGRDHAERASLLRQARLSVHRERLVSRSPEGLYLERVWTAESHAELEKIMAHAPKSEDLRAAANKRWAELTSKGGE